MVLIGWPAVLLGSKHRFIGLAHLAGAQPAQAAEHLTRAVAQNGDFAALQTRTRFDLARALIRQRGGATPRAARKWRTSSGGPGSSAW